MITFTRARRWRAALVLAIVASITASLAPTAKAELSYTRPTIPTDEFQILDLPAFASWLTYDGDSFDITHETEVGAQFDEFGAASGETFDTSKATTTNPVPQPAAPFTRTASKTAVGDFDGDDEPEVAVYSADEDFLTVTGNLGDALNVVYARRIGVQIMDPAVYGPVVNIGVLDGAGTAANNGVWLMTSKGRVVVVHPGTPNSTGTFDLPMPANSTVLDATSQSRLDHDALENSRTAAGSLGRINVLRSTNIGTPAAWSDIAFDTINVNLANNVMTSNAGTASTMSWVVGAGQIKSDGSRNVALVTQAADPRQSELVGAGIGGPFCVSTDASRTPEIDYDVFTPRDAKGGSPTSASAQWNITCAVDAGVANGLRQIKVDQVHQLEGSEPEVTSRTFPGSVSTSGPVKISDVALDLPCPWLRVDPPLNNPGCSTNTNFGRTETLVHYKTAAGTNAVMVASMAPSKVPPSESSYRRALGTGNRTIITLPPMRNRVRIQLDDKDSPTIENGRPRPLVVLASPPYVEGAGQVPLAGPTYNQRASNGGSEGTNTSNHVYAGFGIDVEDPTNLFGLSVMETIDSEVGTDLTHSFDVTSNEQFVGSPTEDVVVYDAPTFFRYDGTIIESSLGLGLGTRTTLDVPRSNIISSATFTELQRRFPTQYGTGANKGELNNILTHSLGDPSTYTDWGTAPASSTAVSNYCDGASFDEPGSVPAPAADENQGYPFGAADNPFIKPELAHRDLSGAGILNSEKHQVQVGSSNSEGAGFSITDANEMSRSSSLSIEADVAGKAAGAVVDVGAGHTWGKTWTTNFETGVDFLAYVGHIPTVLDHETYDWRVFLCKKKLAGGLPVWVLNYTVDDYHGSGGLEPLGTITPTAPIQSVKTTTTPEFDFGFDSGTIRSFDLDLEAIGANDARSVTNLEPATDHIAAKSRSKSVDITWSQLNQTNALKPNQLYRWRTSGVDFFENETQSDWEYFVTDGNPTNAALAASPLTATVGQTVTLTASNGPTNATPTYTFDLGDGRIVGPQASPTLTTSYPVAGVYPVQVQIANTYGSSYANTTISVGPKAVNESYTTLEDTPLTKDADHGVMVNDTGADSVKLTAAPEHGVVKLDPDGAFTFTPDRDECGTDQFAYAVRAGGATRFATTTVHITCVNDKPVGLASSFDGTEDQPLSAGAPGVLAGASDVENDALTAKLKTQPSSGAVTLSPSGAFTYTPAADFCGTDTFTWAPNDGHVDGTAVTTTLHLACVNDAPTTSPARYTATEDTARTVSAANGLLSFANDVDTAKASLTTAVVAQPSHGAVSATPDGAFTYTPAANYCGPDSFPYTVSDNIAPPTSAIATITVACVNDAPTAIDQQYNAVEDTPLNVAAPSGLLVGATDIDGDALTAAPSSGTSHGVLTVQPTGSFSYTPAPNFCGTDSFSFTANDAQSASAAKVATITVACVNDAPVARPDTFNAVDGALLTVATPGLLANDTDVEGEALQVTPQTVTTALGSLSVFADGSLKYTARPGTHGLDTVNYVVRDPSGASATGTATFLVKARTSTTANKGTVTYNSRTRTYTGVVTATLRTLGNGAALPGQTVAFVVENKAFCSAITGANGVATCSAAVTDNNTRLFGHYVARFTAAADYLGSVSATTPFGTLAR